jgi:hypothetical protein
MAMKRPWDAIAWWEIRRIPFNLLVLAAGALSILIIELIGTRLVKPGEDVEEPIGMLIAVAAYAVAANLCYTLSWITELVWSRGDTSRTESRRPKIFRAGLIFSAALTLLPAILVPAAWLIFGFK